MYKSSSNAYPVVGHGKQGRKEGLYDSTGDIDIERRFSNLGLGCSSDRISPMSRSHMDLDFNITDLLPSNFGVTEERSKDKDFFRRPIGSERYGPVRNEVW